MLKKQDATGALSADKREIDALLKANSVDAESFVYGLVPSTNLLAEEYAKANPGKNALFVANEQSAGSGRLGRSFFSPGGKGLYMTLLFHPEKAKADGVWITAVAAVAVRRAIMRLSPIDPRIKWVNDLYADGKKLCGILAKASLDAKGEPNYILVGIGINLYKGAFPDEIKEIATSIETAGGGRVDRNTLAAEITKEFFAALDQRQNDLIEEYKRASLVLGKKIKTVTATDSYYATATDITDSGELVLIKEDGKRVIFSTGEVSIRDF